MVLKAHVEKFYAILDRHLQKAGLLIKIQLLPCMSEKRTVPGISFHTLKKLNLYHCLCPTQLFEGRYFSVFFSKLKFFHWWNMLMHTPFWNFFFFAYTQSVFAMTTILGFWRMALSLLLLKFIVDVILFSVQIFLFFFHLFLLYRHMSVFKRKCQEQCHLPGDYYYRVLCNVQFSSVTQSCPTLCNPTDCSTPGLPDHHRLPEFTQTQVHLVGHAIQPSHPLSSPSPPAFNLSQHQGLFKWVSSLHQVAKVLEFQLQHQSF